MVKAASKIASKGGRIAGSGAGGFLTGIFSSPAGLGAIGIATLLVIIFIFKDRIAGAIGGFGENFGKIELPEINIPNPFENFELPKFEIPELPKFEIPELPKFEIPELPKFEIPPLFGGGIIRPPPQDLPPDVENTGLLEDPTICACGSTITQDIQGDVSQVCKDCAPLPALEGGIGDPNFLEFLGLTPAQAFALQSQGRIDVPANDPTGLGGGQSFIGGTTTFGDSSNIIDTLTEVLNIFPNLTASQAANALFANPDLTANEFAQITPIQPSISSAGGDPEQIINNASGGFSGLTPEQIAFILTGGNISNF